MVSFVRSKTAPSPYPRVLFHLIRIGQALAAFVVSAVMGYFIWNLVHEDFNPPKTFWTLLAASILTVLGLIATAIIYAFFGLSPIVNLGLNAILLGLWAPAFAFLWFWTRGTLSHVCSKRTWQDSTGIMICRIYKALFAFAILGVLSTFAALILDLITWRRTVARGKYSQMQEPGEKRGVVQPTYDPKYEQSRGSIQLQPYAAETHRETGYGAPEEQFRYDTSYQGGHQPI